MNADTTTWGWGCTIGIMLIAGLAAHALAADSGAMSSSPLFQDNDPGYVGGRGLITAEEFSGMYLNPTSGTLAKGHLTAQFFASVLEDTFNNTGYYNALLSYGITD